MNTRLTVFTPTYNRAYILHALYDSLVRQTDKNFEWLIVDDGSTDNTRNLIQSFINENRISIRYEWQENAGKSAAHNLGVSLSDNELFLCVDSDDFLVDDAVEKMLRCWDKEKHDQSVIGVVVRRIHGDGSRLTRYKHALAGAKGSLREAYNKKKLAGDTNVMVKTEVLKKELFPIFAGEKFVPEGWLWARIEQYGKLYFSPIDACICEYLADGYTKNVAENLFSNPRGYLASVEEHLKLDSQIVPICKDLIRYIAMSKVCRESWVNSKHAFLSVLCYPAGLAFYNKRYAGLAKKNLKYK